MENYQNNEELKLEETLYSPKDLLKAFNKFNYSNCDTDLAKMTFLYNLFSELLIQLDAKMNYMIANDKYNDEDNILPMLYDMLKGFSNTDVVKIYESVLEYNSDIKNTLLLESVEKNNNKEKYNINKKEILDLKDKIKKTIKAIKERDEEKGFVYNKNKTEEENKKSLEYITVLVDEALIKKEKNDFLTEFFENDFNNLESYEKDLLKSFNNNIVKLEGKLYKLKKEYPKEYSSFIDILKDSWKDFSKDGLKALVTLGLNNVNPILGVLSQLWFRK